MCTALRRSSRLISVACAASTSALSTTTVRAAKLQHEAQVAERNAKPAKRVRKNLKAEATELTNELPEETQQTLVETTEVTKKSAKRKKKVDVVEPSPEDFVPRVSNPWKIGPHVSAAGGVENTIINAATVGANAFALSVKSQRKWESSPLATESITAFKSRLKTFGYSPDHILPHGNYLINLGNPDEKKREKSFKCFLDDLERCEQLGLRLYNFHPGSTVGQVTKEESLSLVAACVNRAHKETESVVVVLENMAGSGNTLGSRFAELGRIIRQVQDKSRIGVCLDTCHMFAAGYDIRTKDGWESTMAEFEREIGIHYLRGMHLNDSKGDLSSHVDRHDNIGLGHLSMVTFVHVLTDPRTQNIPLILETPVYNVPGTENNMNVWRKEVEVLNLLAAADEKQRGEVQLKSWADDIGEVVKKASADKDAKGKRMLENAQARQRKSVRRSKASDDDDDALDRGCDHAVDDNPHN